MRLTDHVVTRRWSVKLGHIFFRIYINTLYVYNHCLGTKGHPALVNFGDPALPKRIALDVCNFALNPCDVVGRLYDLHTPPVGRHIQSHPTCTKIVSQVGSANLKEIGSTVIPFPQSCNMDIALTRTNPDITFASYIKGYDYVLMQVPNRGIFAFGALVKHEMQTGYATAMIFIRIRR